MATAYLNYILKGKKCQLQLILKPSFILRVIFQTQRNKPIALNLVEFLLQ